MESIKVAAALVSAEERRPEAARREGFAVQHHAQKKCCKQPNGSEQMWRERAAAGYESKVCLILPG